MSEAAARGPGQPPWLSVLIPVYNVQAYLRECVESVLAQADAGVEVVLVDDASTDDSRRVMETLQREAGDRLRLLSHARNAGLGAARNTLLDASRGEYVWFLDSDDTLAPGSIAALRAIVERDAPDLVLCDFQLRREQPRVRHKLRGSRGSVRRTFVGPAGVTSRDRSVLVRGVMEGGNLHAWSKIARRSLWGDDLRFPCDTYFEDVVAMPRLVLRAQSFHYVDKPWVVYRRRPGSIMATMSLDKADDLARSLAGYPSELRLRLPELSPSAAFAVSYLAARLFISAARSWQRLHGDPDRLRRYREWFHAASPLTGAPLHVAYLRRGWWWRLARLSYWLRRADRPRKAPAVG